MRDCLLRKLRVQLPFPQPHRVRFLRVWDTSKLSCGILGVTPTVVYEVIEMIPRSID